MTSLIDLMVRARARKPLKFREFVMLLEACGFRLDRSRGTSHAIYKHPTIPGHMNVQPDGRDAKGYQVKQFIAMIDAAGIGPTQ